jgi:hypothetical protein
MNQNQDVDGERSRESDADFMVRISSGVPRF